MNPLLNIQWDAVRMIAIDGAQVEVLTLEGPQTITFTSEAAMEVALHEWFRICGNAFVERTPPRKVGRLPA